MERRVHDSDGDGWTVRAEDETSAVWVNRSDDDPIPRDTVETVTAMRDGDDSQVRIELAAGSFATMSDDRLREEIDDAKRKLGP